jgi:predicted transcriptional regulator
MSGRKHDIAPFGEVAVGPDVDLDEEEIRDSRGRRVTKEYADDAAEDALRKVGRGRPALGREGQKSPQVTFRLTPELRAQLEQRAATEGKKVSEVAREAVEQFLAPSRRRGGTRKTTGTKQTRAGKTTGERKKPAAS